MAWLGSQGPQPGWRTRSDGSASRRGGEAARAGRRAVLRRLAFLPKPWARDRPSGWRGPQEGGPQHGRLVAAFKFKARPPLPGNSLSASDMMMLGLFPPSSRVTLLRLLLPAATWICWPTCKEGGKDELSGEEKGPNAPRHRAEDPTTGGLK